MIAALDLFPAGLCPVMLDAKRLQVRQVIGAAVVAWHDMVNLGEPVAQPPAHCTAVAVSQ